MTASILLRSPFLPSPSPSPSPSPISAPLPALQPDLSSSSSSSASGSYLDLHRASSARSTRRIRFAPLPEPNRDLLLDPQDPSASDPQPDAKPTTRPVSPPGDIHDGFIALSPSVSPDSTLSSVRSTPTIRLSPDIPSKNFQNSNLKIFRPFSFFRRADSSSSGSPLSHSTSLPSSRNPSLSSLTRFSNSVPNSPSLHSAKLPRISTEDVLSFGRKSIFRPRSGSANKTRSPRTSSPPPRSSHPSKSLQRSVSTGSAPAIKHDCSEGSSRSCDTAPVAGSGPRRRRASSSALSLGAGGGRHSSPIKMLPSDPLARPSTAPSSPLARPKKYVKMLNGRVYGAKRYAAQTLANPFANVRDDPEFVEWGYGGMGSVHASADIGNDMWKGLQRSERGGALLAGSSPSPPSVSTYSSTPSVGGGRGGGARATSPIARRKMSDNVLECGMGSVNAGGPDEDDGSGVAWLKKRRAEREAKARLAQEINEIDRRKQEKRKSGDSIDASMYASTASAATSLTACTSAASTDLTTPSTSPLGSRSPSITDMKLTSSPASDSHGLPMVALTTEQSSNSGDVSTYLSLKDEREHHILTAVRISPSISISSHKHEGVPLSPVDTETTTSTNSSGDDVEESSRDFEEEADDDDYNEHDVQDLESKTALGAGVEKISRHVDVEAR